MFTDKKVVSFKAPKMETISFQGQDIQIKPYLSIEEQTELIRFYLDQYFQSSSLLGTDKDYLMAEYTLITAVIDKCTDVKIFGDEGTPVFDIDSLFSNDEFWNSIKAKIKNYDDFYRKLKRIVEIMETEIALRMSVGYALDTLVDSVSKTIEKIGEFDFSDSTVDKIKDIISEVNASPILQSIAGSKKKSTKSK